MSLLLCQKEPVKHPFYVPELGVRLHSSQELCYVIYENPLLAMDDFINDGLIRFIRDDLNMGFLAGKLETWKKSQENPDNMLLLILTECSYYPAPEINRYRQTLIRFRKSHPAVFVKARADYLMEKRQYGKAILLYEKLLDYPQDRMVNEKFFSRIWCCLGACHARMFQFEKAYHSYEKAYFFDSQKEEILERIYYLSVMFPNLVLSARMKSLLSGAKQSKWDKKIEEAKKKGRESEPVKKLDELFMKNPEVRIKAAEKLVHQWKQEYRSMM